MSSRARLPEELTYVDSGCEVASKCVACPLARCKFEVPLPNVGSVRADERRIEAIALRSRGLKADEIARALDVSRRTVFRLLERRAA